MNTVTSDPQPPEKLRKILVATVVLLLAAVFLAAFGTEAKLGPWFWFGVFLLLLLLWTLLGASTSAGEPRDAPAGPHMLPPEEQPDVVRQVMDVQLAEEEGGVRLFRGHLRESAEGAFARLKAAFGGESLPLIQKDARCGEAIFLMPYGGAQTGGRRRVRTWVNWLLFGITLLTTTWAGALQQGVNLLEHPDQVAVGLPYSIALLAILGVHELGHYWVAKRNGMDVTPPFFIPVPFALGTFGAFIQMRSPAESRRSLFDVAVAGPFAGLAVAIPALLIGLRGSEVISAEAARQISAGGTLPGTSVLFTLLANVAIGPALDSNDVIQLSPLAFAGWLGLFVTALNLLPVGQLDGGHIARAMFGSQAGAIIGGIAMWTLLLLGLFVWPGLLMWALIVFLIAGRGAPPLNDITPISRGRMWLGALAFVLLLAIIVPASAVEWVAQQL